MLKTQNNRVNKTRNSHLDLDRSNKTEIINPIPFNQFTQKLHKSSPLKQLNHNQIQKESQKLT